MSRLLKLLVPTVLAVLVALGVWVFLSAHQQKSPDPVRPDETPPRTSRSADGQNDLTLDPQTQQRIGLKTEELTSVSLEPRVVAYGTLEEDPSHVFVLRAPIAGTLHATARKQWPELGENLADGATVGTLEPQFTPADEVRLASELASAKADEQAASASLTAARDEYERLKKLNVEAQGASEHAVQQAQAKMQDEEARQQAARRTIKVLEAAMAARAGPSTAVTLKLDRGGQVVQVPAQPGEAVEAGQQLLKVARFQTLLAAVTVPLGEKIPQPAPTARILVAGFEQHVLSAKWVAVAPAVSDKTLGQTYLFRVASGNLALRPGMALTAYLPASGGVRQGVVIPRSAIVHDAGRAWAYVQQGDRFFRREVATTQPTEAGWFVTQGWEPGQRVVVTGAQVLLSNEVKSHPQAED